jgi:SPP1 family phage portal protein
VRIYEVEEYEGDDLKIIEKAEIYKSTGIERYILQDGVLREAGSGAYFDAVLPDGGIQPFNWEKIPVIAFKYNDEELPLICRVKSLQDALNDVMSDFMNNMQEDARNTILVIKNYDGGNLSEFRYNLAAFGAVKVRSGGEDESGGEYGDGGVETLKIEVNSENYKALIELLKQAIIENARGFDAKELKSGTPNQMNIKSMYSDIDLDANGMETEWQAAFEDLLYFVNAHLANTGKGDFEDVKVEIVFNRDILMNESDIINNVKNSVGILSMKTILAHNPWVDDVSAELERLNKEKQEDIDAYADSFLNQQREQKEGEDE